MKAMKSQLAIHIYTNIIYIYIWVTQIRILKKLHRKGTYLTLSIFASLQSCKYKLRESPGFPKQLVKYPQIVIFNLIFSSKGYAFQIAYALGINSGNFPNSSVGKESSCNAGDRVQFLGQEDPLEKEMATHSSILAWRIPWTEVPGRLQSMRLQESGTI